MAAFDYINRTYGLSVKRGTRVRYTGGKEPRLGTITDTNGAHLRIRMDGDSFSQPYHPTWELEVLQDSEAEIQVGDLDGFIPNRFDHSKRGFQP